MNLVIFNMANVEDWEKGVVNRNYFIVRELLKRSDIDKVLLVDFLSVQSHKRIFGKKRTFDYGKMLFSKAGAMHKSVTGFWHRLFPYTSGRLLSAERDNVYLYQGLGVCSSVEKQMSVIKNLMEKLGFDKDETAIWSYNPFIPEVFDLPSKLKIFDAVDNWAEHASYKNEADTLRANYQRINKLADTVFTVSDGQKDIFDKSSWIPNGVDLENFQQTSTKKNPLSKEAHPIIGYIGTIQERLDFDLIDRICSDHPSKTFVFIGPIWDGVKDRIIALQQVHKNIRFLGRIDFQMIPAYLQEMDATIIPHRLDQFIKSTNPMKMYDFLAAGKTIITTPGAGTEMFDSILYIRDDYRSFSQAIDEALQSDSDQKRKHRIMAVEPHSWKARVDEMMAILN